MIPGGQEFENGSLQHQRVHLATLRAEGHLTDGVLERLGRLVAAIRPRPAPAQRVDPGCCPA
jgi:hypothetical protein